MNDQEELLEDFIDKYYSDISDLHYEIKQMCFDKQNGLFYHSNDYDFINLLKKNIEITPLEDSSESDDDNYEISDI